MDDFLDFIEKQKRLIKEKMNEHAVKSGIRLNPDEKIVNEILDKLMVKKRKYNEFYCPMRIVTGDESQDRSIICPCIYHLDEVMAKNSCLCTLFVR